MEIGRTYTFKFDDENETITLVERNIVLTREEVGSLIMCCESRAKQPDANIEGLGVWKPRKGE